MISATTAALSISVYVISHQKSYSYLSIIFWTYFFDVSLVLLSEYKRARYQLDGINNVDNYTLIPFLILGSIIIYFLICYVAEICSVKQRRRKAILFTSLFVLLSLIPLFLDIANNLKLFFFFFPRTIFMAGALIYIAYYHLKTNDRYKIIRFKRQRLMYVLAWLGLGCMLVNNIYLYLMLHENEALWFARTRNFGENIFFMILAFSVIWITVSSLHARLKEPPEKISQSEKYLRKEINRFCEKYKLSNREKEIFTELINHKSYPKVSDELFISISTIKVHVHNILKKTGKENRKDLV